MDRQSAIKELTRGGRKADLKSILATHAEKAQAAYAAIRADERLTDDFKRRSIAERQVQVHRAVDAELEAEARKVIRVDRDDAAQVFGIAGLPGDAATLIASRRDAGDRVADITDTAELRNLLRRANRSGDEVMARAIAERAVEIQAVDVVNGFIADRPKLDAAVNRLWNSEQAESGQGWLEITILLSELRAKELHSMDGDQVEQVAYTEPDQSSGARAIFGS